jgi:hypothetical protein
MENVMVSAGPQPDSRLEKEKLIQLAKKILKSDSELRFLLRLETEELKTLVACMRVRLESDNR